MVLKFGKTGQFLGCSQVPRVQGDPADRRPAPRRGRRERAHLPQVRQAAVDPREQARREVPVVLGISRVQGVVQHRRRRATRSPRWSRPNTSARSAASRWCCARGRGGRSWAARATPSAATRCPSTTRASPFRPSRSRSPAPSAAGRWRCSSGRRGSFLGCLNYPECRGTAPVPDELKDQLAEQAPPAATPGGRPEVDPGRGDLRALRRPDAGPPQPPRVLPRLRQVSQVQGDPPAGRGHAGEDQRRGRVLNQAPRGETHHAPAGTPEVPARPPSGLTSCEPIPSIFPKRFPQFYLRHPSRPQPSNRPRIGKT